MHSCTARVTILVLTVSLPGFEFYVVTCSYSSRPFLCALICEYTPPNQTHATWNTSCVYISQSHSPGTRAWEQGHVIPVIFILLFWPSIEVARSCSVVKHREVPQVWEAGGYFLNENGEIGDIVFVHPQGLQFWHRGEDDVWTKFITVQDKCCEICQSAERVNVTESVREKSEDSERKNTSLYLAIECVNVHLQKLSLGCCIV